MSWVQPTPQEAAQWLGYEAGRKHDEARGPSWRLSVKDTAQSLAEELKIIEEVRPIFIEQYQKGCRATRKSKKEEE